MKPSVYAKGSVELISELNRRDELLAARNPSVADEWVYDFSDCRDLSLAGVITLSRILRVKVEAIKLETTDSHFCAVAKASYRNTLVGAYSVHKSSMSSQLARKVCMTLAARNAVKKVLPPVFPAAFANRPKVYFAHAMSLFGSKRAAYYKKEIFRRARGGWVIIDPSKVIRARGSEAMRQALAVLKQCQALVFIAQNSIIPKGTFDEIRFALEQGISVSYLHEEAEFTKVTDLRYFERYRDFRSYARISL